MTPTEKDDLILRHLDDDTSPVEVAEVTRLLREDSDFRSRFLAFVHQAARLRDILDTPPEMPPAQAPRVERPGRTACDLLELDLDGEGPAGEDDTVTIVRDLHGMFEREWQRPEPPPLPPRRRRGRLVALGTTVAAVAVVVVLFGYYYPIAGPPAAIAVVDSTTGDASLLRGNEKLAVTRELDVLSGDQFTTDSSSQFTLKYPDDTLVRVDTDTQSSFATEPSTGGKLVTIDRGEVSAEVAKQPSGKSMLFKTPMADAKVLGTVLRLAVEPERTRLEVTEGRVELARPDGEKAVVAAGYFGIATPEGITVGLIAPEVDPESFTLRLQVTEDGQPVLADNSAQTFPLVARGKAQIDDRSMVFSGGAYLAEEANAELLAACRETNELTVEATIQPANLNQEGPARIIAFSACSNNFNFILAQEGDQLVWRLTTSGKNPNEIDLYQLPNTEPHHVIVTYRDGQVVCYVDGKKVKQCKCFLGDFGPWKPRHLLFGDEWEGDRAWLGTLSNVAIYDRFVDEEEAGRRAALSGQR